jgi:RHS repeat-associated protein
MVEESVYYPYGANRARTGSFESEYRFTGKELDDETGLHYFGARYYDSQVGRFVSVDPLINKNAKTFTFQYVDNNPIKFNDPKGLSKMDVVDHLTVESMTKKSLVLLAKAPNWKCVPVAAKGLGGGSWLNRATQATVGNGYWRRVPNGAKIGPYFAGAASFLDAAMDVKNGDYTGAALSGLKGALEKAGKSGAGTLMGIIEGGYNELTDRGYSVNEVVDAFSHARENITFGIKNPDAFIDAGIEGTTSVSAIAINAASFGLVDISGKQVQTATENVVNKVFDFFGW